MSTDSAWEEWGRRDPYYGVITDRKFRKSELTPEVKAEFFESGRAHADYVLHMIRTYIDAAFQPHSVLDFGCGVGRVALPFGRLANQVVGADVSSAMLDEARKNCIEHGVNNVRLIVSDDNFAMLDEEFDLIHSFIVFQHIPPDRGRTIFGNMLRHLRPGGACAVHFAYAKMVYAETHGIAPPGVAAAPIDTVAAISPALLPPSVDPEMQMNSYPANELLFLMQVAGVHRFHVEFTDHGGELGIFIFFQKPVL